MDNETVHEEEEEGRERGSPRLYQTNLFMHLLVQLFVLQDKETERKTQNWKPETRDPRPEN